MLLCGFDFCLFGQFVKVELFLYTHYNLIIRVGHPPGLVALLLTLNEALLNFEVGSAISVHWEVFLYGCLFGFGNGQVCAAARL